MFIYTMGDIFGLFCAAIFLICVLILAIMFGIGRLIEWFNRWRLYKGEKDTKGDNNE